MEYKTLFSVFLHLHYFLLTTVIISVTNTQGMDTQNKVHSNGYQAGALSDYVTHNRAPRHTATLHSNHPLTHSNPTNIRVYPPDPPQTGYTTVNTKLDTKVGDNREDIWMLGLFPFTGSWAGGLGQLPAIQMGIDDVNANPHILPGYRLRMTVDNTECNAGIGTNVMYERLYEPPTKVLVLGAGCSAVSQATAQASHLWNLLQLSYSSASPALSDKIKYKRFFRVFPPESSFNHARLDLLEMFEWKKVGTLYQDNEEIFKLTNNDFLTLAKQRGVQVLTSESFVTNPRLQIQNLKKHGARIIIGNFYENKARLVFCEAYKQGMYGAKYVWIITGFYSPEWWKNWSDEDHHDCTRAQLEKAIEGYFTADALPLSLSETPGLSGKTYDEFITEYGERTHNETRTGFQEAPYGYDSVWAVANMLNNSLTIMEQRGLNKSLTDFLYNDSMMAEIFLSVMNMTAFEGVSGPVMYDESGDRQGLTQIEQLHHNVEVRVGVFDPTLKSTNKIRWDPNKTIVWIDGDPPSDSIIEKQVPEVVSAGLFLTMTVLASLGIVLACLFLGFNIKYRHSKYIKMSSPNMNNIILLGAILSYVSVIFCGLDTAIVRGNNQLIMCKFFHWTLALSFSLAFGAMFSKTWRVHKIFTNKKIQRMVIKDYQLMAIVCVLVGADVLILAVWEFLDPLQITSYNKVHEQMPDPLNDNQILIPQMRFCESPHMWYFAGILYAIKGLLLVFGAFLSFETRKVTVLALNDSKFIGLSVYNVVVLCLVGVPVSFMMKESIDASYALISLFVFFATTLTICLVFIPKILHRNHEPHTGQMFNKTADTNGHRKKPSAICLYDDQDISKLKEENDRLRHSLDQCRRRLRDLETCNGLGHSPKTLSDNLASEPSNTAITDARYISTQDSLEEDYMIPRTETIEEHFMVSSRSKSLDEEEEEEEEECEEEDSMIRSRSNSITMAEGHVIHSNGTYDVMIPKETMLGGCITNSSETKMDEDIVIPRPEVLQEDNVIPSSQNTDCLNLQVVESHNVTDDDNEGDGLMSSRYNRAMEGDIMSEGKTERTELNGDIMVQSDSGNRTVVEEADNVDFVSSHF